MMKNSKTVTDQVVIKEITTKQVVALMMTGCTKADVCKELKISLATLNEILQSQEYLEAAQAIADKEFKYYIQNTKQRLTRLTDKAVKAIEELLDSGAGRERLEAAKIVLKSVGLDQDKGEVSEGNLTIVLPSGVQTKPDVIVKGD